MTAVGTAAGAEPSTTMSSRVPHPGRARARRPHGTDMRPRASDKDGCRAVCVEKPDLWSGHHQGRGPAFQGCAM